MKKKIAVLVGLFSIMLNPISISAQQSPTSNENLNVKNLKVDSQTDTTISLSWDAVTEAAEYRVEYGTSSVTTEGETYNGQPVDIENSTNAVIENLTPETEYFFSVVAFSADRAEVSSQYSNEVSATTLMTSTSSWKIEKVEAIEAGTVVISFNETVVLPEAAQQEISIRELNTPANRLNIVSTKIDENDSKKLIINTEAQSPGTTYAIELSDKFQNNSNESLNENNRSDTFDGFTATPNTDIVLKVDNIQSLFIDNNYLVELDFNTNVKSGYNLESFKIVESNDPAKFLTVKDVKSNNSDASKILLVTENQAAIKYTVILSGLEGESNESLNDESSLVEFTGQDGSVESNPDPVVAEKLSDVQIATSEGKIEVTWKSGETEKGFDKVRVTLSTDGGNNFGNKVEVSYGTGKAVVSTNVDSNIKIKVEALADDGTVKDSQMFDLKISETGPAGLLGLMAVSGSIAGVIRKRKK